FQARSGIRVLTLTRFPTSPPPISFDWLPLGGWGFPAVALVGTRVRPEAVAALARFERVYLAPDQDEAGRAAADALLRALGRRAEIGRAWGGKERGGLAWGVGGRVR